VIFVDTGFFFALASEKDPDHPRALEVWQGFRGRRLPEILVTTNHVIMECITLTRVRISHHAAVVMGERLYSENMARMHRATAEDERAAFAYLKKYRDKEYSAVDCLSFVVMDKLGITEALAVDDDFTHRFVARPGPPKP
jgi:predicted nucleic acid-binding protein